MRRLSVPFFTVGVVGVLSGGALNFRGWHWHWERGEKLSFDSSEVSGEVLNYAHEARKQGSKVKGMWALLGRWRRKERLGIYLRLSSLGGCRACVRTYRLIKGRAGGTNGLVGRGEPCVGMGMGSSRWVFALPADGAVGTSLQSLCT